MSDSAWDIKPSADLPDKSGATWAVRLEVSTHLGFTQSEWNDARSAAITSLAAFDTYIAGSSQPSDVKTWFASLPSAQRDRVRKGAERIAAF